MCCHDVLEAYELQVYDLHGKAKAELRQPASLFQISIQINLPNLWGVITNFLYRS